jgi:hypothetical protein
LLPFNATHYEKKIKYRCSTIPPVSTTKKNHLSPQTIKHKKYDDLLTYADGNPSPVLRQVIKCYGMGLSVSGIVCYL